MTSLDALRAKAAGLLARASLTAWLGLGALAVAGFAGGATLVTAATLAEGQSRADTALYGSTIAARLAASAVDPLLNAESIALNVLAREFTTLAPVATAAVYSADNRLLAAVDGEHAKSPVELAEPPRAGRPNVFVREVVVDGDVAGYVRIALEPGTFAPRDRHILLAVTVATALLAAFGAALAGRRIDTLLLQLRERLEEPASGTARNHLRALAAWLEPPADTTPEPQADAVTSTPPPFMLVLNLLNQQALPSGERRQALDTCVEGLHAVASLYNGYAEPLPGTGAVALLAAHPDTRDPAFQAVCAAMLARRVLAEINATRVRSGRSALVLRVGLDRVDSDEEPSPGAPDIAAARPLAVQRTMLLSALGRDERIAIGERLRAACAEPDDLDAEPVDSPALRAPGAGRPLSAWLIRSLPGSYEAQVEREAELLLSALRTA